MPDTIGGWAVLFLAVIVVMVIVSLIRDFFDPDHK